MNLKEEPPESGFHSVCELGTQAMGVEIKIEDTFPCDTTGCNSKELKEVEEPDHTLQCLLVKILQESETPNIHIEQIRTILSERYKYFYHIPPSNLVVMIKNLIETEPLVKGLTIILNEDDHCVLLSCDTESTSLEYVRYEIKMEYDDDDMDARVDPPGHELMSDVHNELSDQVKHEDLSDIDSGSSSFPERVITGTYLILFRIFVESNN